MLENFSWKKKLIQISSKQNKYSIGFTAGVGGGRAGASPDSLIISKANRTDCCSRARSRAILAAPSALL